ncbi:hypothetical protein ASD21_09740 [Caulobacter sp. Root1455]|nr:hypothetical protein ASD21_09740 [Caulobacter sp. Root1455]
MAASFSLAALAFIVEALIALALAAMSACARRFMARIACIRAAVRPTAASSLVCSIWVRRDVVS